MQYPTRHPVRMSDLINATTESALLVNGITPQIATLENLLSVELAFKPLRMQFEGREYLLTGIISQDDNKAVFLGYEENDSDEYIYTFIVYKHKQSYESVLDEATKYNSWGEVFISQSNLGDFENNYVIDSCLDAIRVVANDLSGLEEMLDGDDVNHNTTPMFANRVSQVQAEKGGDTYHVIRLLGKGGRGLVYLVAQEVEGVLRQFALKVHYDEELGAYEARAYSTVLSRVGSANVVEAFPGKPFKARFRSRQQHLGKGTALPVKFLEGTTLADLALENLPILERQRISNIVFSQFANVTKRMGLVGTANLDFGGRNAYVTKSVFEDENETGAKLIDMGEVASVAFDAQVTQLVIANYMSGDLQQRVAREFLNQILHSKPELGTNGQLNINLFSGLSYSSVRSYLEKFVEIDSGILDKNLPTLHNGNKEMVKALIRSLLQHPENPLSPVISLIEDLANLLNRPDGSIDIDAFAKVDLSLLNIMGNLDTWLSNHILDNQIIIDWDEVTAVLPDKLTIPPLGVPNSIDIYNPSLLFGQFDEKNVDELIANNTFAFIATYWQSLTGHYHTPILEADETAVAIPFAKIYTREFYDRLVYSMLSYLGKQVVPPKFSLEQFTHDSFKGSPLEGVSKKALEEVLCLFNEFFKAYYNQYVYKNTDVRKRFDLPQFVAAVNAIIMKDTNLQNAIRDNLSAAEVSFARASLSSVAGEATATSSWAIETIETPALTSSATDSFAITEG